MPTDTVAEAGRDPRRKRRLVLILSLAGGTVFLFLLLVWPTFHRYPGDSDRHRVNRLTGEAQVYDKQAEAWRPARGSNSRGTGKSPSDSRGPRSGGPAPGGEWWHDGKGSGSGSGSRRAGGKQWWWSDEDTDRSEPPSGGSPIGGSRRGGGGGGGGGSPIGGSRSGGGSPIGGGGSPIGGD